MGIIKSVRGAREFYPETMRVRNWLYDTLKRISISYGYQEYDGPFLETLELYAAKSGEELVKEQAFVFPDRGGNLITLRPELTPSLARMVAQKQRQLAYPLRWWSFGPMWRYERPGKGRSREFFQWNIDLIGIETPEADAELVAIAAQFLKEVGLKPDQVQILVNNRRLMDAELVAIGVTDENRPDVLRMIDRRDKMSADTWQAYALDMGLTLEQFEAIKGMMDNEQLWEKSEELTRLFEVLEVLGLREYVRYAPYVVRGLDYYTGTVFEAWDNDGEFRAILGGGRYDNLVGDVGGDPLSGVGFAMGDMVVSLVLEKFGCIPSANELAPAPILLTVFDESLLLKSMQVAGMLRSAGLEVAVYPAADKFRKQLKYASKIGSPVAVIMGSDEAEQGNVTLKDLRNRTQVTVPLTDASDAIRKLLA